MYLKVQLIEEALKKLEAIHPFYGTTFLVCKMRELPVGETTSFPINARETEFLDEFYKPLASSEYFFRVFRPSDKQKHWIHRQKYASSTLQSIRTQTVFASAFLHSINTDEWGWKTDYISILRAGLVRNLSPYKNRRVPAFDMAVWLLHNRDWPSKTQALDVISTFLKEFHISPQEEEDLFDLSTATEDLWQPDVIDWRDLQRIIKSNPPDVTPEEGGKLSYLKLEGVGPARSLSFEPGERLNLITGDNGLGKTFLLECAWWALTGQWTNPIQPAYPMMDAKTSTITYQIAGSVGTTKPITVPYRFGPPGIDNWQMPEGRPVLPGLLIYARVDGSFAVCDPASRIQSVKNSRVDIPRAYVFTREQVWEGDFDRVQGQKRQIINGLLTDWVNWQNDPDQSTFKTFTKVLDRLSPPDRSDLGKLHVGLPVRLPPDTRTFPTLVHPYGTVPIQHASAGVKRILSIAYLLVWAWNEHKINSKAARKEPQQSMVILIDEIEAHLHPQWQRRILPALLQVKDDLVEGHHLDVQSIIATHSPLVLASAEPTFNMETDKLFHLDIATNDLFGKEVVIQELHFENRGLIDSWLTSEVFELAQARSLEGEKAVETAKSLQVQENPSVAEIARVTTDLHRYIAAMDTFWPRWTYFAEKYGVEV